jgi:hypothetical protein
MLNESRRMLPQPADQPRPNIGVKRLTISHRVSGIGINHRQHRLLVLGQIQVPLHRFESASAYDLTFKPQNETGWLAPC